MSLGTLAAITTVLAGIGAVSYLMTASKGSGSMPPPEKKIKHHKNIEGVLFVKKVKAKEQGQISTLSLCEEIGDILRGKEGGYETPSFLNGHGGNWDCVSDDEDEEGSQESQVEKNDTEKSKKFYGFFFDNKKDVAEKYSKLSDKDSIIEYISKEENKQKFKQLKNVEQWEASEQCNLKATIQGEKQNSFFIGPRDEISKSWPSLPS